MTPGSEVMADRMSHGLGPWIIGIDTGGTFTDVAVIGQNGGVHINKAPTTPDDFSRGVMEALREVAGAMGLTLQELLANCAMLKHGTTVATNAMINRQGVRVGLITTKGFEDTTLIMRAIGRVAGLDEEGIKHQATAVKPEPIVPRELIRGVTERIDYSGKVVIPLNVAEAREAARSLIEDCQVEAIAVNLLWGFVNPAHERLVREIIAEVQGEVTAGRPLFVTLASDLVPVVREYARSNTVIINAFLCETVNRYIDTLGEQLVRAGYRRPLLVMQSNGGIVRRDEMTPIGTLGSGPCGGVIASNYMADLLGHRHVICTDMGGTSFDVGLIVDGFWRYAREPVVERFHITWPMIDIESIGAGGGTTARVDPVTQRLLVGPASAGASPGPVCYDRGGMRVTVTDADVVLGLLNPDYFLGGRMPLNLRKAQEAIRQQIADPLGIDPVAAASGIYDIVNGHMSNLIRKQVVRVGYLPEQFKIYSYGGAGPVHAAAYGAELGVETIHIFPTSSVFSAFGIAAADIMHTLTTSYRCRLPVDPKVLNDKLQAMEEQLKEKMEREGFSAGEIRFRRTFYMRYRRQLNELEVPVPVKRYEEADIQHIMNAFDQRYEGVYGQGSAYREAGVEIISFQVDAVGAVLKPQLQSYPLEEADPQVAIKGQRQAYFSKEQRFLPTSIYDYDKLPAGSTLSGAAIIETPVTTIVIPPGCTGRVDRYRNIELSFNPGP